MKESKLSSLDKFTIDNCWDIRFFDKAGNADVSMAKKAFEWCKKEYPEWFSEETPFVLEHNRISWNDDDGSSDDVDYSQIPSASPNSWCDCSPEEWLQQVGDGINAKIIIAEFIKNDMDEEAESYYKSVVYENGKVTVVDKFNFNGAAALRLEEYGGNDCDTPGIALNPKTFEDYKGKFRNKKTGEEKLSGSVTGSVYEDEDGDVFWRMEFELNGEKSYVYDSSDYFVDALDKFIEESYHFDEDFADNLISNFADEEGLDEDGWEFAGFDSEPSIFESYFGNQADDYEDGLDDEDLDEENMDDDFDDEDYEEESDDCDEDLSDEDESDDDDDEIKLENLSKKDFVFVKGTGKGYDKINDFYICKYPVTQALYEKITGENPSSFKGPNRPVESLLAEDAVMFCNLLSKKMGLKPCFSLSSKCNFEASGFRLPTLEEWKWAAKGGVKSKDYKFAGSNNSQEVAVYGEDETADVGTLKPNELGLYDMSGNVAEMCFDETLNRVCSPAGGCYCYSDDYCEIEAEDNPFYDDDEEEEESKLADWIGFRLVCNGKDFCDAVDEDECEEEVVVVEKPAKKAVEKKIEKKVEKSEPSVKAKSKYQPTDLSAFEIEGDVLKKVVSRDYTEIVIPEGIKTIGECAVGIKGGIESIILPEGLTTIEFKGLVGSSISTITLPNSLIKLCERSVGSSNLTEIRYEGTVEEWITKVQRDDSWLFSLYTKIPSVICSDGRADLWHYNPDYDYKKETEKLKKENPKEAALVELERSYPEAFWWIDDENYYINIPIGKDNGVELMIKKDESDKWIKDLPEFISLAKKGSYNEFRQLMAEKKFEESSKIYLEIEKEKLIAYKGYPRYLIIPDGVKKIVEDEEFSDFERNNVLTSIELPASVSSIGKKGFAYLNGLTTVTLNKELKTIGEQAFYGSKKLKAIIFRGTINEWNKINKGDKWTGEGEDLIAASVVHCSDGDVEI